MSNVADTSIEAYKYVLETGILEGELREVYRIVGEIGPCTSGEAFAVLYKERADKQFVLKQSRARFTELRERGAIEEIEKRPCKITGRRVKVYQVTGKPPGERVKKKSRKEIREEALEILRGMYKELSSEHQERAKELAELLYKL